jgi:hypothetical protein
MLTSNDIYMLTPTGGQHGACRTGVFRGGGTASSSA